MKKFISRETLLAYPTLSKPFVIHTDASKVQLGAIHTKQDNKPIAFYGKKLNPTQVNYTTTERELISIVESLKEILLGQQMKVYTDHKSPIQKYLNTEDYEVATNSRRVQSQTNLQ